MKYNTQREKLQMPEYGRGIQDMITYATTLPTKEERQRCAESIFGVMSSMQPQLREQPDYKQRIWDHIAYISGYQLDIDYPCAINRLGEDAPKPTPIKYPMKDIRQRQYGYLIEESLRQLAEMPEGEEREVLAAQIAHTMKREYLTWNSDTVEDTLIVDQMAEMSDNRLQPPADFQFNREYAIEKAEPRPKGKNKKRKK